MFVFLEGVYLISLGVCLFRECLSNVPGCLCFVSMNYLIVLEASIWGWGGEITFHKQTTILKLQASEMQQIQLEGENTA